MSWLCMTLEMCLEIWACCSKSLEMSLLRSVAFWKKRLTLTAALEWVKSCLTLAEE